MLLFNLGFLSIGIIDVLEILIVAVVIYQIYRLLRGSIAFNIFFGLLSIYLLHFIVEALDMKLLSSLLGTFVGAGVLLLIVVFQPEIRRFLLIIGRGGIFSNGNFWQQFKSGKWESANSGTAIKSLYKALMRMSESKTGALIVLAHSTDLPYFSSTGVNMNANLSSDLILSTFFKNAPLHDGAMIIANNQIVAAKCILPVSDSADIPNWAGLRHRSAVGITEHTDALAIIVSEETGNFSYARKGQLYSKVSIEELHKVLRGSLEI